MKLPLFFALLFVILSAVVAADAGKNSSLIFSCDGLLRVLSLKSRSILSLHSRLHIRRPSRAFKMQDTYLISFLTTTSTISLNTYNNIISQNNKATCVLFNEKRRSALELLVSKRPELQKSSAPKSPRTRRTKRSRSMFATTARMMEPSISSTSLKRLPIST